MYTYHDYAAKWHSAEEDVPKIRNSEWNSPAHMPPNFTMPRYTITDSTTHDIVQKIRFDGNQFQKVYRPDFRSWLPPSVDGKARCHTISADYIEKYFVICLNESLKDINSLQNLNTFMQSLNNYSNSGSELDCNYFAEFEDYFKRVVNDFHNHEYISVAVDATSLLAVAISAPRNLRDGYPGTNSSIQSALDIPIDYTKHIELDVGQSVRYGTESTLRSLKHPLRILCLTTNFPQLDALNLLMEKIDVSIYTTGGTIQSSDYQDQNHGNDLKKGNLPFGIVCPGYIYLFKSDIIDSNEDLFFN